MLSVHLPRSGCKISDFQDMLLEIHDFFETHQERSTAGDGLQCGPGSSSGQRLGRNQHLAKCGARRIDAYPTRVGWRSSRLNRLRSGLTRLVSPRHMAASAHPQQNGPQTDHSRGGKKNERWRVSKPHKETTKPPALGGRGRLERNNRKTPVQSEPRKTGTHGQRREDNCTKMQKRHEVHRTQSSWH